MVGRDTRLRLLRERLEAAHEDGDGLEVRRIEELIADLEKISRFTWGDGEIAFRRK